MPSKPTTVGPVLTSNQVLRLLSDHARGVAPEFFDFVGTQPRINFQKLADAGKTHLVKTVHYGSRGLARVEFYDAQRALHLLGKYYRLFDTPRDDEWQNEIVSLIRAGHLRYVEVANEVGESLASQLFEAAGVRPTLDE